MINIKMDLICLCHREMIRNLIHIQSSLIFSWFKRKVWQSYWSRLMTIKRRRAPRRRPGLDWIRMREIWFSSKLSLMRCLYTVTNKERMWSLIGCSQILIWVISFGIRQMVCKWSIRRSIIESNSFWKLIKLFHLITIRSRIALPPKMSTQQRRSRLWQIELRVAQLVLETATTLN